ncbi:DJ-1/PfpI family protein [Acanthopleuribacter pedis]|uniref:DJ-1/PfpI family protein n=1 Tax=Acanthopleuribacter pedis TaxID=442870 RepID=A0A8J7Q5F4_9BACT|nr:DJ-1/PfpI family protein [Acanthopleuribacter pedis]MBO1319425.1 DJ-1/PfpI family protein [Acanthopleuribacter pedis]
MFINRLFLQALAFLCFVSLHAGDKPLAVGILVYDGLTISEVTGALETYGMPAADGTHYFNVWLVGETKAAVTSHEGLRFLPNTTMAECPPLDVLVVPGSYNAAKSENNLAVRRFLQARAPAARYLTSHCAGAFVLGNASLLDGKRATTYVTGGPLLQKRFPAAAVQPESERFVVDGKLVTSNGALVSYEASLWVVRQLAGNAHADYVDQRLYLSRLKADTATPNR